MKKASMTWAVALILTAGAAHAGSAIMKEERPGLLKMAKISAAAATNTAQARVPKGKIVSAEIEEEGGRLIYSFDVKTQGKTGIDEVSVDAITGKTIDVQHETPADEAKEKAKDQIEAKTRP